jgi:hypothetical protein
MNQITYKEIATLIYVLIFGFPDEDETYYEDWE